MINIAFTVFSLVVIVVAVVAKGGTPLQPSDPSPTVLSAITGTATPEPSPVELPASPSVFIEPTPTASVSATPLVTLPLKTLLPIEEWIYPVNSNVSQSDGEVTYTASTDAKTLTNWYKDRLVALGYKTKSIIQTQSNERLLNKLSGSTAISEVMIEMSQETQVSPLQVKVLITSSNSAI